MTGKPFSLLWLENVIKQYPIEHYEKWRVLYSQNMEVTQNSWIAFMRQGKKKEKRNLLGVCFSHIKVVFIVL